MPFRVWVLEFQGFMEGFTRKASLNQGLGFGALWVQVQFLQEVESRKSHICMMT